MINKLQKLISIQIYNIRFLQKKMLDDSKPIDYQKQYCKRGKIIIEQKEQLIKIQLKFQKERQKYSQLSHRQQYRLQQNNYQTVMAKYTQNQWMKTILEKDNQVQLALQALQQRLKKKQAIIHKLKSEKQNIINVNDEKIKKLRQQISNLNKVNNQLNDKLKEKKNICKVMMAKIYSLEAQCASQEKTLSKVQELYDDRVKEQKEMNNQEIQANFIENSTIFSNIVESKLREQLIHQFFSIFLKSFERTLNQPNLQTFRLNLQCTDIVRMSPYCQCFLSFLKLHQNQVLQLAEPSDKQKWIIESLSCLQAQRNSKIKEPNNNIVYLFRISSLFYRINNSMQGTYQSISEELIKKIKNDLFMAYYNYFY